jgi:hypothetical protein
MTAQNLWIVVSNKPIEAFQSLDSAVDRFDNLSDYVVNDAKIVRLDYDPKSKDVQWKIEEVPLKEIAKKMMEKNK